MRTETKTETEIIDIVREIKGGKVEVETIIHALKQGYETRGVWNEGVISIQRSGTMYIVRWL